MPLYAICSSSICGFQMELPDENDEGLIPTPPCCPECQRDVILFCHACRTPMQELVDVRDPHCWRCGSQLREAWLVRAPSCGRLH